MIVSRNAHAYNACKQIWRAEFQKFALKYHEISFLASYFKTVGEGRVLGFKPATFRQHTSDLLTEITLPRLYYVQFLKLILVYL